MAMTIVGLLDACCMDRMLAAHRPRRKRRGRGVFRPRTPGHLDGHVAVLVDATLADAICDRLLHNAHRLVLKGPSRRKETQLDS
jgi:IstB-like ATP binding protein